MTQITTFNPATGNSIAEYNMLSDSQIENALKISNDSYRQWKNVGLPERVKLVEKLALLLEEKKRDLAHLITEEMGKPISQSIAEVSKCAMLCQYYAEHAEEFLKPELIASSFAKSYIRYDPLGVILGIMPWNFPFWQVLRYAVPTILAGNATVLKHAPNTMGCGLKIQNLMEEAGIPKGVFQSLVIDIPQVESVIGHPYVQGVTFTGSDVAGAKVAELSGKYLKKCMLEMGGSDPFVVLKDADVEMAAKIAVKSRMFNTGQTCISAKRFFVHIDLQEVFIEEFVKEMKAMRIGDPKLGSTDLGCMARKDLADKVECQMKKAIEMGAKLVSGGERKGNFISPALLVDVGAENIVFKEEVFGPVAAVSTFADEEEVIEMVNISDYGLGASIWSRDIERAEKIAVSIDSGTVAINGMVISDPRLPFGGVKKSGYGRELASHGIREFTNLKTITVSEY
ncbi:NAD-dependent succinate-semialdehyde dehydrogenase [Aureibacter tunicatorum]|uniref:Succinate-semialdehyde dehydrogenase/glutarate-semialdehyde dehydrogenase n=1 Tax=Aureibacter tunicatorum TaxID=866807 RepID=A0AAE3XKT3_9BACT|nr:NAD-dependent succinate-semialdehyde dehydrogenase [Aureibacter tunicatorum]MDR6238712.1 succinate-semialdehyde dehydrogenase/glutarate-semialdehyde dehydrogenase [Aureibacter tunicatorum]BDD05357.1 aldehyde dehydrogenase [Aureibacter tunicatorum]